MDFASPYNEPAVALLSLPLRLCFWGVGAVVGAGLDLSLLLAITV
jgi:hypothetical protein